MARLSPEQRQRMHASLDGLSVGDAFGERLFFEPQLLHLPLEERHLPAGRWDYTDDTQMALSLVEVLHQHGVIDQEALAHSFATRFEYWRGYGRAMYALIPRLQQGQPWQQAAQALFGGQGSFGNGAAMRVAPLGACFADDIVLVVEQAARSAEVTHSHPEALAGAIAVAIAAAMAWQCRHECSLTPAAFLERLVPFIPHSQVCERVTLVAHMPANTTLWQVIQAVGNGSSITAQDTVPFALWCAAQHLDDYPAALWLTASGLGDIDTNCAIVGGIVASAVGSAGIPATWLQQREPLPAWIRTPPL